MNLFSSLSVPTLLLLLAAGSVQGQVTPSTPSGFERRGTGNNLSGASTGSERKVTEQRKIIYTVLSPLRDWKNTKGVVVPGRLLAFETGNHEGSHEQLTLVHEGKVRLLVESNQKVHELALTTLSEADQEYVAELVQARLAKAKAAE